MCLMLLTLLGGAVARPVVQSADQRVRMQGAVSEQNEVQERGAVRERGALQERLTAGSVRTVTLSEVPDSLREKYKLEIPDSLQSLYRYTDALKRQLIYNDTTAARKLFEQAVEGGEYAPALYELARARIDRNDAAAAIDNARRAYESDTMNRWYAALYAQALVMTGQMDEALPLFQRLMRIDRNNADYYRIVALIYQQRRQPFSAIAILDSADLRFGKIAYLSELKRNLLISTGQMDRAIDEARQNVEAAPYDQMNVLSLGETYAAAGKDSLARVTLQQALKMDSTNIEVLSVYADFCSHQRQMHEYLRTLNILYAQTGYPLKRKVDMFNQMVQDRKFYTDHFFALGSMAQTLILHYPDEKSVIDLYANHLIAGGQMDLALDLFKQHLDDEPPQMDFYMAVIDIEEYKQRTDSLEHYLQRAMEQFPDDAVFQIRKANRQYVKGDLHGAIATFVEAQNYAQSDSLKGELWGYIGDAYHAIADRAVLKRMKADTVSPYPIKMSYNAAMKRCYEAYDKALELWSDNVMVLNNYAYFLSEQGSELERAERMSARAIAIEQNNSTYLDTYAWILYRLGRLDEARTYMRQALSLDRTGSAELPLHYGDILFALGENFMAETYWRKALEAGATSSRIEKRIELTKSGKKGRVEELLKRDK